MANLPASIDLKIQVRLDWDDPIVSKLFNKLEILMGKEQDAIAVLIDLKNTFGLVSDEVDKVAGETKSLQDKIDALSVASAGITSPEFDAALAEVKVAAATVATKIKGLDDMVPDLTAVVIPGTPAPAPSPVIGDGTQAPAPASGATTDTGSTGGTPADPGQPAGSPNASDPNAPASGSTGI